MSECRVHKLECVLARPFGCEIGTIAGPAEWASEDAVRLIETALDKS